MSSPPNYSSPVLHVGRTQHALPQAHNAATSLPFISVLKPEVVVLRRCACSYSWCFEGALPALLEEHQRDSGAVLKVATNHAYSIVVVTIRVCSSNHWLRLLPGLPIRIQHFGIGDSEWGISSLANCIAMLCKSYGTKLLCYVLSELPTICHTMTSVQCLAMLFTFVLQSGNLEALSG